MSVQDATTTPYRAAAAGVALSNVREAHSGDVRARSFRRLAAHPDVLLTVGLLVVALVPRILYLIWAPVFIGGDSSQYFQPVYDLLNNGRFTLSLKRPPLYPWMLYAEQLLFGP